MAEDLLKLEQQFEDNAFALGAKRFITKLRSARDKGAESTVGAGKTLMRTYINDLIETIRYMCERGGRGRRHVAVKACKAVGYETAAFMTLKAVVDGLSSKNKVRNVARTISGLIIDELRYRRFRAECPKLFDWRMREFTTSNYHHMKRSLDATLTYGEVDTTDIDEMFTVEQRLLVGIKMIDLLIETTNLVELKRVKRYKSNQVYIEATDATLTWLRQRNNVLQSMLPVKMPMVVPPKDWEPGVDGGYRYGLLGKDKIIRGNNEDVHEWEMPAVYTALNAIQGTPWKINQEVYRLVDNITRRELEIAGLPKFEDTPLPPKPTDIATNEDAKRTWKSQAFSVHEKNHKRRIAALAFEKVWGVVRRVRKLDRIWFPMNLDFRGRVYPISHYLHPQGDDLCRALLTFADDEAKPLGEDGAMALAQYGATLMDEDPRTGMKLTKLSKEERREWAVTNTRRIVQSATRPLSSVKSWWGAADKPLQFFAWCVEWARFIEEGSEMLSSLPIHMDGSCNGVQHFSAMLRDTSGGMSVNLIPSARPSDLYSDISETVVSQLESDLGNEMAQRWITSGLVSRKLCKRPTMTFGYGSKQYGFRHQLMSDFPLAQEFGKDAYTLAGYMAKHIWTALQGRISGAFNAMTWLQECARSVVKETRMPLMWTTPSGFRVTQRYYVTRSERQIETVLAGRLIRPVVYSADLSQADLNDQADGVAPNFVHALDAAALVFTMELASRANITALSTVHDSFATVAADYNNLNLCTREAFVWMYEQHDVLNDWRHELEFHSGVELSDPPPTGDLDLGVVRDSEYFFS